MLQIKLSKGSSTETGGVGGGKPCSSDMVTVACPDHLVLADLPVGKSLGPPPAALLLKTVGRKNRRPLGERVHFCVRCDLPIAIYGRLSPCDHVFCLECARLDPGCYLCDQKIVKIQTIKLMEGIFICAAPHCLVSFLSVSDFESHIHENHANLLNQNNIIEKEDGNELEDINVKQQQSTAVSASDSTTARAPPPKLPFSPTTSSNSQINDRDEKYRRPPMLQQPRPPPPTPFFGQQTQIQQLDQNPNYPPNFQMQGNPNQILAAPPPMFGAQPFYGGGVPPFEPGSVLGFPPNANFQENYPRPWNMGQPVAAPFDPSTANMAPLPHLQPPMMPPQMSPHMSQQSYPGGEMGNDGQGFGWQYDKRDNFGNNRESQ
ncbi:E3 ubiquitin-protein ligase HAKAI homolog [Impatiens glandulifera]|uniref:E3 ubiquitin-protein ligase HAKAI homolog n=1 Tax=Impatiens glandulifera TaxID=253017 RepID=UPI001FB1A1C7|nr:E3 ubiquitin-protein ligase HAKAI homolog [Impatiens glandulifera]